MTTVIITKGGQSAKPCVILYNCRFSEATQPLWGEQHSKANTLSPPLSEDKMKEKFDTPSMNAKCNAKTCVCSQADHRPNFLATYIVWPPTHCTVLKHMPG